MSRRATIKDVAAHAGVSTAAVSYVLNNRAGEISEATRARVLEAVKSLGYRPDTMARSLAGHPTRSLGLIWSEGQVDERDFAAFLAGLGESIYADGLSLVLAGSSGAPSLLSRATELLARRVDGLVLFGAPAVDDQGLLALLAEVGCPAVLCGASAGDPAAHAYARPVHGSAMMLVGIDEVEGMRLAGAHLLSLGHLRLAYLDVTGSAGSFRLRRRGFEIALARAEISADGVSWVETDGTEADAYQQVERLLRQAPRPTGILCAADQLAVSALRAAWKLGVQVPDELAVVGFGDHPVTAYTVPTLTTVRGSMRSVGQEAGRGIVAALRGGAAPVHPRLIPPKLVIRESCGSHLWV